MTLFKDSHLENASLPMEIILTGRTTFSSFVCVKKWSPHTLFSVSITAIAGGDTAATDAVMGGTEFTREVSLLSRDSIAENGGWL